MEQGQNVGHRWTSLPQRWTSLPYRWQRYQSLNDWKIVHERCSRENGHQTSLPYRWTI